MSSPSNLPPQHQAKAVLRYAPHMVSVIENFPGVTVIDPSPLAPVTFSCRFRDAIRGLVEFDQVPVELGFNPGAMALIWPKLKVAVINGLIVAGPQNALAEYRQSTAKTDDANRIGRVVNATIMPVEPVTKPTADVINAICTLIHHGLLESAVIRGADISEVQELIQLSDYDAEVVQGKNNELLLI